MLLDPKACDLCRVIIVNKYVDGATRHGPWANMCLNCHAVYGLGLGTSLGQLYRLTRDPKTLKVEWIKVQG